MEAVARRTWLERASAFVPKGVRLPEAEWRPRHRIIQTLLWLHVPAILGFGLLMGETLEHTAWEASIVVAAATLASVRLPLPKRWEPRRNTIRATLGGFGLVSCSAILTHLSGGYIEMHFHFFVMVAVMALYQDWPPFLLAIVFVALHHGVAGVLDPRSVYNHPDALANPWKWAAIHAFFILGASAAAVTTWSYSEQSRLKTEQANGELASSKSLLEATLDATADGILVVDSAGHITSHNEQFVSMWRIPPDVLASNDDEAVLHAVAMQLVEPDAFMVKVRALYARPEAESFDTLEFKDGRVFERFSKPQRIGGRTVGRVWSFRDVTERRRAEKDRILAGQRLMDIQRLEEVNQFKTRLLNTASHELNTPLTPLRLQLHMLQDPARGQLSESQRRSVQVLDRNLARLSSLVRNVLDVARLQSDRLQVHRRPVNIRSVVHQCLEAFVETARQAGVVLVASHSDRRAVAQADADRLMQVLVNLVSNALKFTPQGGHVTVRTRLDQDDVVVEVQDTGRGLTRQEMAMLFQPFSQVGDVASENPTGTGLGLYICKGIVDAHGGTIGVDSGGPMHGATFWFRVPCQAPTPATMGAGQEVRRPPEISPSAPGAVRSLG